MTMEIEIPEVADIYYQKSSQADRRNRYHPDDLGLERKFEVQECLLWANNTISSMFIVGAWLL